LWSLESRGTIHKFFVVFVSAAMAAMPHNDVVKKQEHGGNTWPAKGSAAHADFHILMGEVLAHDGGG
jgi:hypothetical protein